MQHLCYRAFKNTYWIYQELAVLTKTLLTNSIPAFLHLWSSCNLVHFAAYLAHFSVPISVLLNQYSNFFFYFFSIWPTLFLPNFLIQNLPLTYLITIQMPRFTIRQSSNGTWHPPLTTYHNISLIASLWHETLKTMTGKYLADIKEL